MNAGSISASRDIGLDSYSEYISGINAQNRDVALDAAGFVLGYYDGDATTKDDYWSPAFAGQSVSQRFVPDVTSSATQADYKSLYNGNIAYMVTALTDISQAPLDNQLTAYRYDQLNRIKQVRAHRNFSTTGTYANTFNGSTGDDGKYHEDFSYDRNGNILSVLRNGNNTGTTQVMDNFTYHYYDNTGSIITYSGGMPLNATNKLAYVGDAAGATNYTTDIDNQTTTTNYEYDDIGNLVKDVSEEIYDIDWYANGKIHSIRRTATSTKSDLEFIYDAAGNRIVKIVKPRDGSGEMSQLHWTYTYYVRDAQGNVLAVYERTYAASNYGAGYYDDKYKLTELDIYSSKRLGVLYADTMQYSTFNDASFTDTHGTTFTEGFGFSSTPVTCHGSSCVIPHKRALGHKAYEVTNHLGNVLETVSDRKLPYDSYSYTAWSSGTKYAFDATRNAYYQSTSGTYQRTTSSSDSKADYYLADVRSYSDYYAFGAQMDGRFGGSYRYDFNGKETDDENGGDLDFGARIYDPRLGRFMSTDPLASSVPWSSDYSYAGNDVIRSIDKDGKYKEITTTRQTLADGTIVFTVTTVEYFLRIRTYVEIPLTSGILGFEANAGLINNGFEFIPGGGTVQAFSYYIDFYPGLSNPGNHIETGVTWVSKSIFESSSFTMGGLMGIGGSSETTKETTRTLTFINPMVTVSQDDQKKTTNTVKLWLFERSITEQNGKPDNVEHKVKLEWGEQANTYLIGAGAKIAFEAQFVPMTTSVETYYFREKSPFTMPILNQGSYPYNWQPSPSFGSVPAPLTTTMSHAGATVTSSPAIFYRYLSNPADRGLYNKLNSQLGTVTEGINVK